MSTSGRVWIVGSTSMAGGQDGTTVTGIGGLGQRTPQQPGRINGAANSNENGTVHDHVVHEERDDGRIFYPPGLPCLKREVVEHSLEHVLPGDLLRLSFADGVDRPGGEGTVGGREVRPGGG